MAHADDVPFLMCGGRLTLRDFVMEDVGAVLAYASDPLVTQYLIWGPNTRAQTEQFLAQVIGQARNPRRRHVEWGIVERATGQIIGGARLTVRSSEHRVGDIGYVLCRDRWGQGYGTETARLLLHMGFQTLKLHRIEATCDPDNGAARRILEHVGMQDEGRARQHLRVRGTWCDSLRFAVLETEERRPDGAPTPTTMPE